MFRALCVALLCALLSSLAHACDAINVEVLPFTVASDYTRSADELGGRVGLVEVKLTAKVSGCTAVVGYANPVLRVASELRRNQCAFEHVLTHENEHVRIYEEALRTLASRIEARSAEDLFKVASEEVLAVLPAHEAHDSPEEYATNATACNGRIAKLVAARY